MTPTREDVGNEARADLREQVAKAVGSYVVHDDHGGPDTQVLHDVIGGDYSEATRRVYELTDTIIAIILSREDVGGGA